MGNFNRSRGGGGRFFGRDGFGRKDFDRGGDRGGRGDRQMFKTTCSNCGKDCEVPFRPTNLKPVYCDDCFAKMGGGRSDRQDRPRFSDRRPQSGNPDQYKGQFENLNIKLDKILRLLQPKAETAELIKTTPEKVAVEMPSKVAKKEVKDVVVMEAPEVLQTVEVENATKPKKITKKTTPKDKEVT